MEKVSGDDAVALRNALLLSIAQFWERQLKKGIDNEKVVDAIHEALSEVTRECS